MHVAPQVFLKIRRQRTSDANESKRDASVCFVLRESIGFASVTIDHEHGTSQQCHSSPASRVTGSLRGAELNARWSDDAFTRAWDMYRLPLCDVGSKRHREEQYVKRGAGLTLGLCESFAVLLKARSFGKMNSLNDLAQLLQATLCDFVFFFSTHSTKRCGLICHY